MSSAEVIVNNIDILLQILLCLSASSLMRFGCVCKQWLSLISETRLKYDHTRRNPNPYTSGFYFCDVKNSLTVPLIRGVSVPPLTFLKQISDLKNIAILHSFNGLILCLVRVENFVVHGELTSGVNQVIVCNPTTRKVKLLRMLDTFLQLPSFKGYLFFDPLVSAHYRVILVNQCNYSNFVKFAIYSSESESWKTVRYRFRLFGNFTRALVSRNGIIHLIGKNNEYVHSLFKVNTAEFSSFGMIEEPKISDSYKIGEKGESLILIDCRGGRKLMIYEMDERENDFSRWIMKIEIDLVQVLSQSVSSDAMDRLRLFKPPFYGGYAVICATSRGSGLEIVLAVNDKVVSYNHESKVMKVLSDLPHRYHQTSMFGINPSIVFHPFIASLFAI